MFTLDQEASGSLECHLKDKKIDPEFLAITGDFIDSSGIEIDKLVALKDLSCPIYFVIGNHERYDLDKFSTVISRGICSSVELLLSTR